MEGFMGYTDVLFGAIIVISIIGIVLGTMLTLKIYSKEGARGGE
jgi:hypothetical protein